MAKATAKVISDVIFNYVHIKQPTLEYKAKPDPQLDHMNKEYIVDVLMPYATWRKFKKAYKAVGAIEKAKSYTPAEYEASFKVKPPTDEKYSDEYGDFTIVKFRQRAYYKDSKDATKQPRVIGATKVTNSNGDVVGFEDKEGLEVGTDIAVGNGSVGKIQFKERTWNFNGADGLNLDLVKIQVLTLVPYEVEDDNDDDFDMDEKTMEDSDSDTGDGFDGDDLDGDDDQGSSGSPEPKKEVDDDDNW